MGQESSTPEPGSLGLTSLASSYTREDWNLLRVFVYSQLRLKDQNSYFGFLWSLLNPLLLLAVLFSLFRLRFGSVVEHYPVFLIIGLIQYTHFANATAAGMQVFGNMREVTNAVVFRKELLVVGTVASRTLEFLISLPIALLLAVVSGVKVSWVVVLLPLVVLQQITLALWVLNPLTHLIEFSRTLILEGVLFSLSHYLLVLLVNLLMVAFSLRVFRKLEPDFSAHL